MIQQQHEDDVPLTFDEWADYSARLMKTDPEERGLLLVEHDLVESWGRCDLHYGTMIADDLRAGRMDLAKAYAARFTPDNQEGQ